MHDPSGEWNQLGPIAPAPTPPPELREAAFVRNLVCADSTEALEAAVRLEAERSLEHLQRLPDG